MGLVRRLRFFLKKLWKELKPFVGAIVTVVLVATGVGAIVAGMIGGALGAAANGGNIIKGAIFGAFSGAAAQAGMMASAIWGGMQAEMQGGKFGHGFIAAGIGALGGSSGELGWSGFIRSAVVGGVATEITGGKFKNGAASAAFMYAVSAGVQRIKAGGVEEVNATANCKSIRCTREGDGWKQLGEGKRGEVEWTGSDVVSDPETDRLIIERKESGGFEHSRRREHGSTGHVEKTCDSSGCASVLVLSTDNKPGTADSTSLPNHSTDTFVQHSHPKGSGSANNNFGPGDHIFLTKGKVNYLLNSSGDLMVLEAHSGRVWQRTLTGNNAGKNEVWIRRLD